MRHLVWVVALVLCACSSAPGSSLSTRGDDAPRIGSTAYRDALEQSTRTGHIYDGLDQRVFLAATRQTRAFRAARVEAYGRFRSLSQPEVDELHRKEREEAARFTDFFVGVYTADSRWNDLSAADSIWRIELGATPGGAVLLPAEVTRIARPDADLVALYPYLTRFWIGYRVRFVETDEAGARILPEEARILRLSSSVGQVELRFDTAG